MGDDTMMPCGICGQPGHWEHSCPSRMDREVHEEEVKVLNDKIRVLEEENHQLTCRIEFCEDVERGYNKDHEACVPMGKHRLLVYGMQLASDELKLSKAAAIEFRDKLEAMERRMSAVWNDAVNEAMMRIGQHFPRCEKPCGRCWSYDILHSMLRGDPANYIPVKERLRSAASQVMAKNSNPDFRSGVVEMVAVAEQLLSDRE